jgi:AraC family transcriptional regulator
MIHHLPDTGYILHEQAERYYGAGAGWLSIKVFAGGQAHYTVGQTRYLVDDTNYLILNHDQPYAISIDADRPVESFCLFFAPGFVEAVRHGLTVALDRALLEPEPTGTGSFNFFERTYTHDTVLSPAIFQLWRLCSQHEPEPAWLIERFHSLAQRLLRVQTGVYQEIATIPAIRAATRKELYRRLHYAKAYADALFTTPITLNDMARIAGLSPNHFLRTFKQVFRQSPYQYIIAKRLELAQHLLCHTQQSVTDICFTVGFESLGAFSWSFRQRVGVSPLMYRRQNR